MRQWRKAFGALTAAVVTAGGLLAFGATGQVAAAASGTGTGYLHTCGSKILDSTGATVRLTGLNWFGMETDNKTFHGLWLATATRNSWQREDSSGRGRPARTAPSGLV